MSNSLVEGQDTAWLMATCIHSHTTSTLNISKTAITASIQADRFFNDVLGADAALVVAEVAGGFALAAVRHMVVTLLDAKRQMRDLDVGLVVRPAARRISILMRARIDEAMHRWISRAVGLHNCLRKPPRQQALSLLQRDPHNSGLRIGDACAFAGHLLVEAKERMISVMPASQSKPPRASGCKVAQILITWRDNLERGRPKVGSVCCLAG